MDELLTSILAQDYRGVFEVCVIEDGSVLKSNDILDKFKKVKKSGSYTLTGSIEMSAASSVVKAIATKKGAKSKNITRAYNEEGQLIIKASDKLTAARCSSSS